MNFDDLKKDWNQEDNSDKELSFDYKQYRDANTAIDLIRKYMRQDFLAGVIATALVFVMIIAYFYIANVRIYTAVILLTYVSLWIALIAYYYSRFIKFYKQTYTLDYDSKENLMWFIYEMKLNMEINRSLSYSSGIIGMGGAFIQKGLESDMSIKKKRIDEFLTSFDVTSLLLAGLIIIILVGSAFAVISFIKISLRKYDKQIRNLETTLNILKELEKD